MTTTSPAFVEVLPYLIGTLLIVIGAVWIGVRWLKSGDIENPYLQGRE